MPDIERRTDETDEEFEARMAEEEAAAADEPAPHDESVVYPTPPTNDPRMTHAAMTEEEEKAAAEAEEAKPKAERDGDSDNRDVDPDPQPEPGWQR